MSDLQNTVRDVILKNYKQGFKEEDTVLEPEEKEPEFVVGSVPEEDAEGRIMYSSIPGAEEWLSSTKKKDLDISSLVHEVSEWSEDDQIFIPTKESVKYYVPQHNVMYTAVIAMLESLKVLVVGPTGSGKTEMYKYLAAQFNQPYYRLGGRGDMESDTIFGKMIITPEGTTEFAEGDFVRAYENGYLVALDEPWKLPPHIMMSLQRVLERDGIIQLDDKPGTLLEKQVSPHAKTHLVLCDNVVGTGDDSDRFAATQLQDSSSLNRVDLVLRLNYLEQEVETGMLLNRYSFLPKGKAKRAVQLANLIRKGYEKRQLSVTMSPRNLMAWLEMAYKLQDYKESFKAVMLERFAEESEKSTVRGFWQTVFGSSL